MRPLRPPRGKDNKGEIVYMGMQNKVGVSFCGELNPVERASSVTQIILFIKTWFLIPLNVLLELVGLAQGRIYPNFLSFFLS